MSTFNHYYFTTHLSHKPWRDIYLAYPIDEPEHRVVLKVFDTQCIVPLTTSKDIRLMGTRLQRLRHPSIVSVLELGIEQGKPYLVSEYQPGGSLRQYLDQHPSGHLSLDEAVAVVMQIGQAAAFAHTQGLVHQDIRPENIMLNDQGEVLLADFDLGAILLEPGLKSRADRRAVSYLSPEQTVGVASPASDQYALGCLLYELVTGKFLNLVSLRQYSPLADTVPSSPLMPMLPRALETVILRALAMRPEERYPDISTFLAELKKATQRDAPVFSSAPLSYTLFPWKDGELFPMMESGSVPALNSALNPALAAHASITSLDNFSQLDEKGVPAVVLPEYVVAHEESHATSSNDIQQAPLASQETPSNVQTDAVIVRVLPAWKRPAVLLGGIVTLLVIALLVTYSFNSRVLPGVKHVSSLAISTAIYRKTATASTSIPPIAKAIVQQKPTVQTTHIPASRIHPKSVLPTAAPAKKSVPPAIAQPLGVGSVQIDTGGSGAGSYVGDEDFSSTTPGRPASASNDAASSIDTSSVSNPAPESAYQSARIGDCLYTISHLTPRASYTVRLHFAENYWTQAGKRTFNVMLNARLVLRNFDIFATAGAENKAVVEQFVVPADSTGTITIQFATVKNNAQINAIEVLAV